MSKALNSPTGRLLRSSRLFSLPPPLPPPTAPSQSNGSILRSSDTATLPYPTRQAIATPTSSRSRGDWGLKRPLPSRAIPKSAPHLRIRAIDNLEHITDFESAADHTQTVAKWQELNMPLSILGARSTTTDFNRNRANAFHPDLDNTALQQRGNEAPELSAERAIRQRRLQTLQKRWKTQGPWVTGMTEDQFQRYLINAVRENKSEFRDFLGQVKVQSKRENLMRDMRDEGVTLNELELESRSRLDEHELDDWIKQMRDDNENLNSELPQLIRDFFDLPAFAPEKEANSPDPNTFRANVTSHSDNSNNAPPVTHPSAGLSYLLTDLVMDNHPLYGPQAGHEPVEARVLRTKRAIGGGNNSTRADIGVAGFVTTYSYANSGFKKPRSLDQPEDPKASLETINLELPGGNKFWVQPQFAHIDEQGRLHLKVNEAGQEAIGVKTGNPVTQETASALPTPGRINDSLDSAPPPGSRLNANYGTALPPNQRYPRFARERGFDVRGGPNDQADRQRSNKEQLQKIQDLADEARLGSGGDRK